MKNLLVRILVNLLKHLVKIILFLFEAEAMIVGYSSFKQLLICSVTECGGWRRFDEDDILLVHSPLNYSYFYMAHTELIAKNLL